MAAHCSPMTLTALGRHHPGSCGTCRHMRASSCRHPERQRHWRVPMIANCFYHQQEDESP